MNKKQQRHGKKDRGENHGTTTVQRTSSASPARSTEFNPDYSYVIKDLRRIGILAGTFMAILVALSFFLR